MIPLPQLLASLPSLTSSSHPLCRPCLPAGLLPACQGTEAGRPDRGRHSAARGGHARASAHQVGPPSLLLAPLRLKPGAAAQACAPAPHGACCSVPTRRPPPHNHHPRSADGAFRRGLCRCRNPTTRSGRESTWMCSGGGLPQPVCLLAAIGLLLCPSWAMTSPTHEPPACPPALMHHCLPALAWLDCPCSVSCALACPALPCPAWLDCPCPLCPVPCPAGLSCQRATWLPWMGWRRGW